MRTAKSKRMPRFNISDPCFIVAEISANHCQDFRRAVACIKKAKECGADAVKFQAYTPDTLTLDIDTKYFKVRHPEWGGQTLYELYRKAYTPWRWFAKLKKVADYEGITFFATAFDKTSIDMLEELGVPFHKIASFEIVDLPLIEYAAKTKKPLIMSTGMATNSEIGEAVRTAKKHGTKKITLLKCVSEYPADPKNMNLSSIPLMRKSFNCPIGLSDHSLGTAVSVAAISLGARIIEKHFTLSRSVKTPDSFFSIEPQELKELVNDIRIAERALGKTKYGISRSEMRNRIFRRSLFVVKDVNGGEVFTEDNVRSIRPGYGVPPKCMKSILGKRAKRNIARGTPLKFNLIADR